MFYNSIMLIVSHTFRPKGLHKGGQVLSHVCKTICDKIARGWRDFLWWKHEEYDSDFQMELLYGITDDTSAEPKKLFGLFWEKKYQHDGNLNRYVVVV
jgi:hypothetical protein